MPRDLTTYFPHMHKSKEYYDPHLQLFVPPEHYRYEAFHPGTMENPSCNDIFHIFINVMVPYHHLCSAALQVVTHVPSQLH